MIQLVRSRPGPEVGHSLNLSGLCKIVSTAQQQPDAVICRIRLSAWITLWSQVPSTLCFHNSSGGSLNAPWVLIWMMLASYSTMWCTYASDVCAFRINSQHLTSTFFLYFWHLKDNTINISGDFYRFLQHDGSDPYVYTHVASINWWKWSERQTQTHRGGRRGRESRGGIRPDSKQAITRCQNILSNLILMPDSCSFCNSSQQMGWISGELGGGAESAQD